MGVQLAQWFVEFSRSTKALIMIGVDVLCAVLALWIAFCLRLGVWYTPKGGEWYLFVVAPLIAVPIFLKIGLYRAIIRYMEVRALWTIIQATTLYAILFSGLFSQFDLPNVPGTIFPLNWLIIMLLIGGSRFFARWYLGETHFRAGEGVAVVEGSKKYKNK